MLAFECRKADIGDLIRHTYSIVEESMPNKVPHKVAKELQDYSRKLWSHTINTAIANGLIQFIENGGLILTKKGRCNSDRISKKRAHFLDKRVLVGQ